MNFRPVSFRRAGMDRSSSLRTTSRACTRLWIACCCCAMGVCFPTAGLQCVAWRRVTRVCSAAGRECPGAHSTDPPHTDVRPERIEMVTTTNGRDSPNNRPTPISHGPDQAPHRTEPVRTTTEQRNSVAEQRFILAIRGLTRAIRCLITMAARKCSRTSAHRHGSIETQAGTIGTRGCTVSK